MTRGRWLWLGLLALVAGVVALAWALLAAAVAGSSPFGISASQRAWFNVFAAAGGVGILAGIGALSHGLAKEKDDPSARR